LCPRQVALKFQKLIKFGSRNKLSEKPGPKKDSLNSNGKMTITDRPKFFYGWYIVIASWIMLFLVSSVAVGIFFKPILEEFGLDRATLSLVQTVAPMILAVASPFLGRLIDRFGPKVLLLVCVASQTLTSVVNGLATSLWHLYIGRVLYEIKALHGAQVLINRWFVRKRGRMLGIVATSTPIGTLVLSPISQYLILTWGWRMTMLFWAGVTFAVLLPLTIFIRDNPEDKGYGPDGEPLRRDTPIDSSPKPGIDALETKSGIYTGSNLSEATKTGSFWLLMASHLICGIGCGFMMTHIVIFATDVGYSEMIGASLLSVQGGVNLVGVLLTGHMSDRIARSKVLALTHFIRSLSFATVAIFVFLGGGSLWVLYVAMALFGFGWFTTAPLVAGLVADLFGRLRMGTIIGVALSCHTVGMAIGAYAGGITFELTHSYYSFFLIQGVLEFLAAIFAFAIKQPVIR
jgi:MFS family permease